MGLDTLGLTDILAITGDPQQHKHTREKNISENKSLKKQQKLLVLK
ncbi:hypothetical protein BSAF29S_05820 [Bacillus safensis subsp. safensis]